MSHSIEPIELAAYREAVSVRDLTDPGQGPHAMQRLVASIHGRLAEITGARVRVHRANPVVPIEDNYDRLLYPSEGKARDARHTRYLSDRLLLRTQTSAMIPSLLEQLELGPGEDLLLVCPGIVYRRDQILLMLRKGIEDIRLLRSKDPRIEKQLLDLDPYQPVSRMPPVRCDLSVMVLLETTAEQLGDQVRQTLGKAADVIEELAIRGETPYSELPLGALKRMGALPGQKNVLLRVVLRHLERTLSRAEANELRDRIYMAVHRGTELELIGAD